MDIQSFTPINNQVLIEISSEYNDKIYFENGKELYIDPSFEKERHASTKGIIIKVPSRLKYLEEGENKMPWITDIEVRPGDQVWFSWNATTIALRDKVKRFLFNNKIHILINYKYLYAAKRKVYVSDGWTPDKILSYYDVNGSFMINKVGNHCIPIIPNGHLLIAPIKQKDLPVGVRPDGFSGGGRVMVSDIEREKVSDKYGRVMFIGKPLGGYMEGSCVLPDNRSFMCLWHKDGELMNENRDIKPYDVIRLRKYADIPFQYGIHADFDGKREFFKMNRRDVVAIIKE